MCIEKALEMLGFDAVIEVYRKEKNHEYFIYSVLDSFTLQ